MRRRVPSDSAVRAALTVLAPAISLIPAYVCTNVNLFNAQQPGGIPDSSPRATGGQFARGTAMRARHPERQGFTVRDGVRLHWELYGAGERTVFLLPTWSI